MLQTFWREYGIGGRGMTMNFYEIYIREADKTKGEMIDHTYRIENKNSLFDPKLREKFLIFHHVSRTGGGVINDILFEMQEETGIPLIIPDQDQAFSDNPPWKGRQAPLVITAHHTFGLHKRIPEPTAYFTMMRNPYAYFLAEILIRNKDYKYPGDHLGEIWSNLERKIDEIRERIGHCNLQTYEHATYFKEHPHALSLRDLKVATTEKLSEISVQNLEGTQPENLFAKATRNVDSMFFFVGITELFEESLFILFDMMGIQKTLMWRPGLYSYWRPGKDEMPMHIFKKMSALLEADLELYHRSRQVLEDMLAEADFGEELIRYKQHARNPYGRLYRELSERLEVAAKTFGFFSDMVENEFQHSQSVIRNIGEISRDFEEIRAERLENQNVPKPGFRQRLFERLMAVVCGIKARIARICGRHPPQI